MSLSSSRSAFTRAARASAVWPVRGWPAFQPRRRMFMAIQYGAALRSRGIPLAR